MNQGFIYVNQVHSHNTRNSARSIAKCSMGSQGQKSFQYTSIELWNLLPDPVKRVHLSGNQESYKKLVRKHLFNRIAEEINNTFVFY